MKNKLKKAILLAMLITSANVFAQQTQTVTFKRGVTRVDDALISSKDPNINYFGERDLDMIAWTWSGIPGTIRSLIKFNLDSIPLYAKVTSAQLILHGVPSSLVAPQGNNCPDLYPQYPNQMFVEKIIGNWDEDHVLWNNQPATSTVNRISIPTSSSRWNWDYTISGNSLVSMVQEMVAKVNYAQGFMIKLQNEVKYRSVIFASSDHPNSTLWPELTVTYTLSNPEFTFGSTMAKPYDYIFGAKDTIGTDVWTIDGGTISTNDTAHYKFQSPGNYTVCHYLNTNGYQSCLKCITLCISDNYESVPSDSLVDFSWSSDSEDPYYYTFNTSAVPNGTFSWWVDGPIVAWGNQCSHAFGQSGPHWVNLFDDPSLAGSGTLLCLPDFGTKASGLKSMELSNNEGKPEEYQNDVIHGVMTPVDVINNNIEILPNPTTKDWKVIIPSDIDDKAEITLIDAQGKTVYYNNVSLNKGINNYIIEGEKLTKGIYFLGIVNNTIQYKQKLIKN